MSNKAIFAKRRDGRVAALQYLYAWSINRPEHLPDDLSVFFANLEGVDGKPRDHYSFGEELIHGVIEHSDEIDGRIRGLAKNWDFERIAKIDLAILRLAIFEMVYRTDIPRRLDQRGHRPLKAVLQRGRQALHQRHPRQAQGARRPRRPQSYLKKPGAGSQESDSPENLTAEVRLFPLPATRSRCSV